MKGGITSGVVYPLAAVRLSHSYRFRSIGGTSAGAIAAGAVAAAEYGRQHESGSAFSGVAELPGRLGEDLLSLFQPTRRMRPFFRTLLAGMGHGMPGRILALFRGFPLAALVGASAGAGTIAAGILADGDHTLQGFAIGAGALLLVTGPFLCVAGSAGLRMLGLPRSYYGICLGNDRGETAKKPPLTRWLADLFDALAGKSAARPLTFGDLSEPRPEDGGPNIDLRMITTSLSQGRPYTFPFADDEEFWFCPDEFRDLFPERVVAHMESNSPGEPRVAGGKEVRRLPHSAEMPIVVGVRMSLSFPLLISAVPLYACNHAYDAPELERCWFSDGGITSNFPIHFFDAPVPKWPTFGIDLMPAAKGRPAGKAANDRVWMPKDNESGRHEAWVGWEAEKRRKKPFAFGGSIFRTAQSWIDNRQKRGAGYRDRIVQIRLTKDEGGMNLDMEPADIERLAGYGAAAAENLRDRFHPSAGGWQPPGWKNQRWLRFRSYMALAEKEALLARRGLRLTLNGRPQARNVEPPSAAEAGAYPWQSEEQEEFALKAVDDLLETFASWEERSDAGLPTFRDGDPQPRRDAWSMPEV